MAVHILHSVLDFKFVCGKMLTWFFSKDFFSFCFELHGYSPTEESKLLQHLSLNDVRMSNCGSWAFKTLIAIRRKWKGIHSLPKIIPNRSKISSKPISSDEEKFKKNLRNSSCHNLNNFCYFKNINLNQHLDSSTI